jgi:hypothetical protein
VGVWDGCEVSWVCALDFGQGRYVERVCRMGTERGGVGRCCGMGVWSRRGLGGCMRQVNEVNA